MLQVSTAIIDLRFDQPDRTTDGLLVNGFANVSRMIDRIADTGFTHVTFGMNVPVNIETGLVDLYDDTPGVWNPNKSPATDLWRLVDYAKSKGLGVYLSPQIVDHTNDYAITTDTRLGNGVTWDTVFASVAQYYGQLADLAQQHRVDAMYVGGLQHGLVTEQYRPQWQQIVDAIRAEFSGQLIHNYFYNGTSVVWDMVDIQSLWIYATLSREPLRTIDSIYQEYFGVDADTPRAVVDVVREQRQTYQKPVILEHSPINAGDQFIGDSTLLGNFYENGELPGSVIDHGRQAARHAAFIKLVKEELKNDVVGLSVAEYAPWQTADWLVDPAKDNPWQQFVSMAFGVQRSPQAERWISVMLHDGDFIDVGASDGVFRQRDLRKQAPVVMQQHDLLDLTELAQDLDLDLTWFARAPGRRVDATGAVWERGNVIYVSTDRDSAAEWWCKVVGVKDVTYDDLWVG